MPTKTKTTKKKTTKKKPRKRPTERQLEQTLEHEILEAHSTRAYLKGTAREMPPSPEHARELVAKLSDQQVRDWLTAWGSTTAKTRSIAQCRAFLAEALGREPYELIPKEPLEEV